jgi:integrase
VKRAKGEGCLIRFPGCRFWYAQYERDGKRYRVSTRTEVRREALAVLRRLMGDSERGLPAITDVRKIHYSDLRAALLESYRNGGRKSLRTRADGTEYVIGTPQLDAFFNFPATTGPSVAAITPDTVREFIKTRQAEGAGNAIINRSLAALRRMFSLAIEDDRLARAPKIRLLREPAARTGFIELPKFRELLAALPEHLRPYILFVYNCGTRRGEAESVEWSQVDLERRFIRFEAEQTKTTEARVVPLPEELVALLEQVEPEKRSGRVFDITNIRKHWNRACAAVGLGKIIEVEGKPYDPRYVGLTIHDFRRSASRNLVTVTGLPERVAMRITGHKTRATFDRYHIVSTDDLTGAMERWQAAQQKLLSGSSNLRSGKSKNSLNYGESAGKSLMALSSRG